MGKKIFILVFILVLAMATIGCSNKDGESDSAAENESSADEVSSEGIVGCGEIFTQGDMGYSVIGARIEEIDEVKFLVLKMEAYNSASDNYNFSSLMNLGLVDSEGNEAYFDPMFSAYEEELLDGTILGGGNKIIGEVAFDVSETKTDEYILQIGSMMELKEAIKITGEDIDKTYDELFENSGVTSEYSVGDTIEFDDVSITFDGVRIEAKNKYNSNYDEEGMGLMVLDMTMVNNSTESLEFTSVSSFSTIREVCSADGTKLEYEDYSYSARSGVEPGETKSETFGLYYDESCKEFYLTMNPDVGERTNLTIVTFSIK